MVAFPTSPAPASVSTAGLVDPVLRLRFDQGHESRRSRYSQGWRRYTLEYLGKTAAELRIFEDFYERVTRGGALSFDWTHPSPHTVTDASNASPIVVTTTAAHGLQTGDSVVIAGVLTNTNANGTHVVTYASATTFSLDGTTGNGAYGGGGTAAVHLPYAVWIVQNETWGPAAKLIGPDADAKGFFNFVITIEQRFA